MIRAYLGARWRGSPLHAEIDDATQDVFVECFREDGALAGIEPDGGGSRAAFAAVRDGDDVPPGWRAFWAEADELRRRAHAAAKAIQFPE